MRLLAGLVLVLLLPSPALGAPAAVKLAEAVVRAEPNDASPSLQVLTLGTLVSVSTLDEAGWRRVRLAEGNGGWIQERALAFPVPAGTPGSAAPVTPDLRPRFAAQDVVRLATLVEADPVASSAAGRLVRRRSASRGVLISGLALSAGLFGYGVWEVGQPRTNLDPDWASAGRVPLRAGLACAVFTAVVAWALQPGEAEVLDVANLWNVARPDEPIALAGIP